MLEIFVFIIFIFLMSLYYTIKGIIINVKSAKISLISLTCILFFSLLILLYKFFSGFIFYILLVYLIISFLEYLIINYLDISFSYKYFNLLFSSIIIETEEVKIKYRIIKLISLFFINLFTVIFLRQWVGLNDGISIEVKTKGKELVFINI